MIAQSQTGVGVCSQRVSWQCLQVKESSIVVTENISFTPGLTDVAFLVWACHAEGHLSRQAFHWTSDVVLDAERGVT